MSNAPHPIYHLEVDCQQIELEVRINDIPILDSNYGHPLTCELATNLYLLDGDNTIEARYSPLPGTEGIGEHASFTLKLLRGAEGMPDDERKVITALDFRIPEPTTPPQKPPAGEDQNADPPQEKQPTDGSSPAGTFDADTLEPSPSGAINAADPENQWDPENKTGMASRRVKMPIPFAKWEWIKGDNFADDAATLERLIEENRRFWKILESQNVDAALGFLANKLQAIELAYNVNSEQARELIEIPDMMVFDEITLKPTREANLKIQVFGNGRLARITDPGGDPPIFYRENDGSLDHYIPLIFCQSKGGLSACM